MDSITIINKNLYSESVTFVAMNKSERFTLIEGTFSDTEAKEILLNIFSAKVQFHELKNFSSTVRFGAADPIAEHRIEKLKATTASILKFLEEAEAAKKRLAITSQINISLVDE